MTLHAAILIVLVTIALSWIAYDYVERSMRSYASASKVWTDVDSTARELLETDLPQSVARAILGLLALAGCGCFVRGVLVSHYLPRLMTVGKTSSGKWNRAFDDVENLGPAQREQFSKLITLVVVYDSFRNPLHGWIFRRTLRNFTKPVVPSAYRVEAQLASFSVLNRSRQKISI